MLDYAADISRAERREISSGQSRKAMADAEDFPPAIQPRAHDCPDGRIHSCGVPAARQYRDSFHFNRLSELTNLQYESE
jgi:hypothetical protein